MSYGQINVSSINGSGLENNYLINPEFTINQRGAASPTATANAYNYDRWYWDGTYLYQGIENGNLRNTTYTLSWTGAMTASYSLNTAASSSQGSQTYTSVANGGQITISSLGSNALWIRFSSQPTQPKLELGNAPTTFVPRINQQELALCQRYAIKYLGNSSFEKVPVIGYADTTTNTLSYFSLPVPMRASPSLTYNAIQIKSNGASFSISAINVDQTSTLSPSFNVVTTGLTVGATVAIQANNSTSAYVLLNAEL